MMTDRAKAHKLNKIQKQKNLQDPVILQEKESKVLKMYLKDVSLKPLLKHEEILCLFQKIEEGDNSAKSLVAEHNLRLVISNAKYYKKNYANLSFEDMIQEGNLGLLHAIDKFDYKKGFRFSTYATWWIKQAISQYVTKNRTQIRMPAYVLAVNKKLCRLSDKQKKLGKFLTEDDVRKKVGVSKKIYDATVHACRNEVSMQAPISRHTENSKSVGDNMCDVSENANPFDNVSKGELYSVIKESVSQLNESDLAILRMRFGLIEGI
jgi:RNA polymerase primary sigma factor